MKIVSVRLFCQPDTTYYTLYNKHHTVSATFLFQRYQNQKSYSTDGGREWCLHQPPNLSPVSCDLELWPTNRKVDRFMPVNRLHQNRCSRFQNIVPISIVAEDRTDQWQIRALAYLAAAPTPWRHYFISEYTSHKPQTHALTSINQ